MLHDRKQDERRWEGGSNGSGRLLKAAAQKYGYVEQEVAPPETLIKVTWSHPIEVDTPTSAIAQSKLGDTASKWFEVYFNLRDK